MGMCISTHTNTGTCNVLIYSFSMNKQVNIKYRCLIPRIEEELSKLQK